MRRKSQRAAASSLATGVWTDQHAIPAGLAYGLHDIFLQVSADLLPSHIGE